MSSLFFPVLMMSIDNSGNGYMAQACENDTHSDLKNVGLKRENVA